MLNTRRAVAVLLGALSLAAALSPWMVDMARQSADRATGMGGSWWLVLLLVPCYLWFTLISRLAYVYLCATSGVRHEWPAGNRVLNLAMYGPAGWWRERPAVPSMAARPLRSPPLLALSAAVLGVVGTQAIDGLLQLALDLRIQAPQLLSTTAEFVGATLLLAGVAPLLETLLMAVMLEPLRRWLPRLPHAAALSALLWGAWHAVANHPLQFFSMVWLFWVLSRLYLALRREGGALQAIGWTALAHALNNLAALGLIVLRQAWA